MRLIVFVCLLAFAFAGGVSSPQAADIPDFQADFSKPPEWWPKGVKFRFPPQKSAPKGWKGIWPPEDRRAHDISFWTEYFKLKPLGPKSAGKPGDPSAPTSDGFAGSKKFADGFPNTQQMKRCKPFRFGFRTRANAVGSCKPAVVYPTKQLGALCDRAAADKRADQYCRDQCAMKVASDAWNSPMCIGNLVRPPLSFAWKCDEKEAGVLLTCQVQFVCNCRG
ncbi:MAG: hypothetical protein AAGG69_07465 [Pseudomonadota bacterium]